MEVGAVKQAFNNEVIQLKKNLNQAKIQVIHKLTRKAKTLTEKKTPEHLKEKNKKKAESAVKEVLIMKKLKPRDIARFIITFKGELNSHLNKPTVDSDKACARLLLNKALQQKYKSIKDKFGDIPIKDLLMSRQERRKLKKEAKDAQKNKKKGKEKVVNSQGDWNVENMKTGDDSKAVDKHDGDSDDDEASDNVNQDDSANDDQDIGDGPDISDDEDNSVPRQVVNGSDESSVGEHSADDDLGSNDDVSDDENMEKACRVVNDSDESSAGEQSAEDDVGSNGVSDGENMDKEDSSNDEGQDSDTGEEMETKITVKLKPGIHTKALKTSDLVPKPKSGTSNIENVLIKLKQNKKPDKKVKENKNKNLNEKMQNRKFKKGIDESQKAAKVVDPFFKTATGENYMSVAEPRQPDEVKEVHRQGNRQERRSIMFGRAPMRPRRDDRRNFRTDKFNNRNTNSSMQNSYDRETNSFDRNSNFNDSKFKNSNSKFNDNNSKFNARNSKFDDSNSRFNDKDSSFKNKNFNSTEPKVEKLHPSWEAKKKQSGILPYKGKKIVFDEN